MTDSEIIKIAEMYEETVIVGAGEAGKYIFEILRESCIGHRVLISDNSRKKQGKLADYDILSVEQAVDITPKALYLISSIRYENIIRAQLVELGIPEERIMLGVTERAQQYLLERKREEKLRPLKKLQFEIDITDHCNLNCKCCSQFSCIADEEYIDIQNMERDCKRLGEIFDGEAERIYLIGGEPLLHPKITDCMLIVRKYFPYGKISIFTNGILLLKCDDEFWNTCRENRISILVTKYPIDLKYEEMIEKAKKEEVKFDFFGSSEDFKYMSSLGLDLEGKQDEEKSFINCVEANNCVKLKNGKLFTCTRPAAIYKFNKFFGKQLKVSEEDYIDIYKEISKEEVLKKLARKIPFCRYCNMSDERKSMEWGKSDKKIEEWI